MAGDDDFWGPPAHFPKTASNRNIHERARRKREADWAQALLQDWANLYASIAPSISTSISISSRYHLVIISISSRYHLDIISLSSRYHLDIISISSRYHLDIISISSRYHLDIISISSQYHRPPLPFPHPNFMQHVGYLTCSSTRYKALLATCLKARASAADAGEGEAAVPNCTVGLFSGHGGASLSA
jgi:hypothetical protein